MDPTPTPQSDASANASGASEPSIEQQLDALLVAIEQQEPGTVEPDKLPDAFRAAQKKEQAQGKPDPQPQPEPEASPPAADDLAQTVSAFEQAIQPEAEDDPPQADANTQAEQAEQTAQADAPMPDPFAEAEAEAASGTNTAEEQDMLAALNAALKDLEPDETAKFGPPKQPPPPMPEPEPAQQATEPEAAPKATPAHEPSEDLTAEINALLNAPAPPAAPAASEPDDASTQDKIAEQIEDLLNSDQAPDDQDQTASIDDIDQMLAEEIDLDDELAGDFHSVQDITAGIKVKDGDAEPKPTAEDDEHAASARDVAAELDSQPEDQPAPAEDPFAALAAIAETAEKNQAQHEQQLARAAFLDRLPRWLAWLGRIDAQMIEAARLRLLRFCFVLNWPARRFLTTEWRANLGYLALIHLFIGVAMWLYLIVR